VQPVASFTDASLIPAISAYREGGTINGGGIGFAARRAGAGLAIDACLTRRSWARAAVYDSPVFRMRARTTRLKSLLVGMVLVLSFGQATTHAPQQRRRGAKGITKPIRESTPLCLAGTLAGEGSKRLGADRRRIHIV
jgi:hypothetical protein